MSKHILKIITVIDFDHEANSLAKAMGADYEKARNMALRTVKHKKTSEAIEEMIFNNNESLQTRILAVFIAGTMRGNRPPIIAIGKIDLPPGGLQ